MALLLVVVVAGFVLAFVYRAMSAFGLVCMSLAGASLLLLDHLLPKLIGANPRYRRILPIWCLVPFALVFAVAASQHYHTRADGLQEVETLARELAQEMARADGEVAPPKFDAGGVTGLRLLDRLAQQIIALASKGPLPPVKAVPEDRCDDRDAKSAVLPPRLGAAKVRAIVTASMAGHFGVNATGADAQRFGSLAVTVASDLNVRDIRPACVRKDADIDTSASFLLALAVQGLFVFWIPCLLAVSLAGARQAVGDTRGDTYVGIQRAKAIRDEYILGEGRRLFMPRLCFGILLLLGTNYVFAPLGLKTTYMMALVDQHATPGQTSFTLWTTSFGQAPVIVAGFVGFLMYALITSTQRFALGDFDDRAMFSLLVRGLVVILLSFALSASPIDGDLSRIFVFVAGVFPVRALEALAKKVSITIDPDFETDGAGSFAGLDGLDPTKAFALRAAGIQSTADLAAMEINSIAERVRIDPRLLARIVDRAILIDAVGDKIATTLEECGVRLATELAALHDRIPEPLSSKLGGVGQLIASRLASDARVVELQRWISNEPEPVDAKVVDRVEYGKALRALLDQRDITGLKAEFVTVDLSAFSLPTLFLLRGEYANVGELVDAVYSKLQSGHRGIDRYQYGRQWELRGAPSAASTAIPHSCVTLRLWGTLVPDPTPLASVNIGQGAKLYVVDLRAAR